MGLVHRRSNLRIGSTAGRRVIQFVEHDRSPHYMKQRIELGDEPNV